jgi:hypothetical protein
MVNIGIDYGMGKTNIDLETGIRFGVINQNKVLQAWADGSKPEYVYLCPYCEFELDNDHDDFCPSCKKEFESDHFDMIEPACFIYNEEGYECQSDDYGDIFITKSPYYTECRLCSPCAPGAGDLSSPVKDGAKTYCFGHDWFEEEKAPYPVYSIETGELIEPV